MGDDSPWVQHRKAYCGPPQPHPRVLAVSHMENQPHRQVGGRVAGAGLPLEDGVLCCPEGKWALAEIISFGKGFPRLTTYLDALGE